MDTETCGFHGVAVLLQYAIDDGSVVLYNLWKEPVSKTLDLLETIANNEICGFNLAFDWFHINKLYTLFVLVEETYGDIIPEDKINELGVLEEKARRSKLCLKPVAALDLMLHARKGPYQSLMERKAITIKRVPLLLVRMLRDHLEQIIPFDAIYFSRRKDPHAPRWQIRDTKLENGAIDPNFKDIVLKFVASSGLKTLAEHALKTKNPLNISEIGVHKIWQPKEAGWAPFAMAHVTEADVLKNNWRGTWPAVIAKHIGHWAHNPMAKKYAENDVIYTRDLYHRFKKLDATMVPGDTDSELACMVGAVRWKGFAIDIEKIKKQRDKALILKATTPLAPNAVKGYFSEVMDEVEFITLDQGTGKEVLEDICDWELEEVIDGDLVTKKHPAAERAERVLKARQATKEIENYDKLLQAGRFHASFKVIGTLSTRMSGSDGLNAQGIKRDYDVRGCFPLSNREELLSLGDFDAFEVCISEAVFHDPNLRKDLLSGKKIHALFGQELSGLSYEEVVASKGTDNDWYEKGKRGIFGLNYGGDWNTLVNRLHVSEELAKKAYNGFLKRYPGVKAARDRVTESFCSMRQTGGIGTKVEWHEPDDYIESLLGFRRYFTLENRICKALFDLANKPPKAWKNIRVQYRRRDRLQSASGATQSALYATAFAIQANNTRAANNHVIQSTGASITKELQRKIWDLQDSGVNLWKVTNMNVHDEVLCVCDSKETTEQVAKVVEDTVESFKPIIPLLKIDWKQRAKSWAEK